MRKLHFINELNDFLTIGAIKFKGKIVNPTGVEKELSFLRKMLKTDSQELNLKKSLTRKLYKSFKLDPTKERPSSEALLRRLKKGEFPKISPFVDISNTFSTVYQVPFGFYDIKKIDGDEIKITIGKPNDRYLSTKKREFSLSGKIVLKDKKGPFGNPSSDSIRTSVGEDTDEFLLVSFFHPEFPEKERLFLDMEKFLGLPHFLIKEISWKVSNEGSFVL